MEISGNGHSIEILLKKDLSFMSREYIEAATSPNTRRSYQSDIRHFEQWGGKLPSNSNVILQYLHFYSETLNPRTLIRRMYAISNWHKYQGFEDPTNNQLIRKTLIGIKRIHGKPIKKAPPIKIAHLENMVSYLRTRNSLFDYRNNAMLQIGFFGAFRRSEVISIKCEHLNFYEEGLEIIIPRSKTDKNGDGLICTLPFGNKMFCPITALNKWLNISGIKSGYVFRSLRNEGIIQPTHIDADSFCQMIKNLAKECRIPNASNFSGHSLRRGLATAAGEMGIPIQDIMRQGRWRHYNTVLGYIDEGERFTKNVAGTIFNAR